MTPRSGLRRGALTGLFLLALFSFLADGRILLLHGWLGSGGNWAEVERLLRDEPYRLDPQSIMTPDLPNRAGLADWVENIARYIDSLPDATRLTVVAHSFAATASLFLLIAAHHLAAGDYESWAEDLSTQDPAFCPISSALLVTIDRGMLADAVDKIGRLFLYHPALGGGCFACACGEVPLPFVCDDSVDDMCLLESNKGMIFSRGEIFSLGIPVVNIYGTRKGCAGPCLGAGGTDGSVSLDEQRLFLDAPNYQEVSGGEECHTDFIVNADHAAERLLQIVFPSAQDPGVGR